MCVYWAAVAHWLGADPRWARIPALYDGPWMNCCRSNSDFLVRRDGEDPRFVGSPLRVAGLRDRLRDVLDQLAERRRRAQQTASLNAAMRGIGMRFVGDADRTAHIEDTLIAASAEGMDREDLRVLSVLTTWVDVHCARVNVDRLFRGLTNQSPRVRAYWSALARWKQSDVRWGRVAGLHDGPAVDLVDGVSFLLRRNGEDPRFTGGPLRVAVKMLRDRRSDVSTPEELARRHRGYYWRVVMGPSYRADMWARLEAEPSLSAVALARSCFGSYATAWQVRRDFALTRDAAPTSR